MRCKLNLDNFHKNVDHNLNLDSLSKKIYIHVLIITFRLTLHILRYFNFLKMSKIHQL